METDTAHSHAKQSNARQTTEKGKFALENAIYGPLSPRLKLNFINFTKTRESLLTANGNNIASAP